jgi:polyisoprenoid-binding protein YceI
VKSIRLCVLAVALAASAGPAIAAEAGYGIDPTHSFVSLEAPRFGLATWQGRLRIVEGRLLLDREAGSGSAELTVSLASLSSGAATVDAALKGPAFLDVAAFPSAVFTSERIVFAGKDPGQISGTLRLRDKSAPLTLKALRFNCYLNPLFLREVCGGDFEGRIRPADWGLTSAATLGLPDELRLVVQIEASKE